MSNKQNIFFLYATKALSFWINHNNVNLHIFKYKLIASAYFFHSTQKNNFLDVDKAISKIYNYIYVHGAAAKINPLIFIILSGIFIFISKYNDSLLFIYLCQMNFIIAVTIKWVIITHNFIENKQFKKNHFKFYCFIRYLLLGILFICLAIMVIVFCNLMNFIIHLIWSMIWGKIKGGFTRLGNTDFSVKQNKPPKNPKNTNILFSTQDHKDIKKKASDIKQKLLKLQNDKLNTNDINISSSGSAACQATKSISKSRKWEHKIMIEKRQDLSLKYQLDKIQFELEAYKNQKKKFQQSIDNIKKGKENFYPDEAKNLWKDYIEVIKSLNLNLKSMKNNLKKQDTSRWFHSTKKIRKSFNSK